MENSLIKYLMGAAAALAAFFAPVTGLVLCAVAFVAADFVTGVAASRRSARERGLAWAFESRRAWDTVLKLVCVVAGIALSWLIDSCILGFLHLRLANLFTGFVCGVEFWSFLENAAQVCDYPPFRWLRRYMKSRLDEALEKKGRDE